MAIERTARNRSAEPGRSRPIRLIAATAAALALVALTTACEQVVVDRVNEARTSAGRPELPVSDTLPASARTRSQEMCAAGQATPSSDPLATYDQESAQAIRELVASAKLDATITDGVARNVSATDEIWDRWKSDPSLSDPRWDDIGVGEVTCGNGRLYLTAVLRDRPSMPATGLYSSIQYAADGVTVVRDIVYGTAVNSLGVTQNLLMDLYLPPAGGPAARPTTITIHGGGFVGGSRTDTNGVSREYALRGFVSASIDYRLDKRPGGTNGPGQLVAAQNGIDDGMEAVRWLKANAATYRVDTTRIGAIGFSAGGAIALGMAVGTDPTPGGPLAAQSPTISAATSTGAHLTPGLSLLQFTADQAAVQMFVYEHDETGFDAAYAFQTCAAIRAAGNTCDWVLQPGTGHTAWLTPGAPFWTDPQGPFLWTQLRLG
jgi:acetyl esterase/lipase/uncharacterized protein YkwD